MVNLTEKAMIASLEEPFSTLGMTQMNYWTATMNMSTSDINNKRLSKKKKSVIVLELTIRAKSILPSKKQLAVAPPRTVNLKLLKKKIVWKDYRKKQIMIQEPPNTTCIQTLILHQKVLWETLSKNQLATVLPLSWARRLQKLLLLMSFCRWKMVLKRQWFRLMAIMKSSL